MWGSGPGTMETREVSLTPCHSEETGSERRQLEFESDLLPPGRPLLGKREAKEVRGQGPGVRGQRRGGRDRCGVWLSGT